MSTAIVVGGGYAGIMTANRALVRGHEVTLVTEQDRFVDRIRLHEVIAGTRTPTRATRRIHLARGGSLVVGRAQKVGEGWVALAGGSRLRADHVVLATGSGAGSGGWTWALRHRDAVASLRPGQRVTVRGGGLTGIEVATELAEARPDLQVTLVVPQPVGARFAPAGRVHLLGVLERFGIDVLAGEPDHDHVIDCTGFRADPLAGESGLPVTDNGVVDVDEHLRVRGFARLWAAGDAARLPSRSHLRMACATAQPMGAGVADQLGRVDRGEELRPFNLGYAMWCMSLGRRDGLIQYVRRDDTPTARVHTGRAAALIKETVCQGAALAPMRFSRFYRELAGPDGR